MKETGIAISLSKGNVEGEKTALFFFKEGCVTRTVIVTADCDENGAIINLRLPRSVDLRVTWA